MAGNYLIMYLKQEKHHLEVQLLLIILTIRLHRWGTHAFLSAAQEKFL